MSVSLVKKSLNLIEYKNNSGNRNNQKNLESKKHVVNNRLLSQSKLNKNNFRNINFVKNLKKVQKQVKKDNSQDNTESNLQKLKAYTKNNVEETKISEFFKRATKSKQVKIEKKEEEGQSSVFTEEDFARFEREYEFD